MAYRRPLGKSQSVIIALLWLVFVVLFLMEVKVTLFSLIILFSSAFIVFYPIVKSYRERKL